MNKVSVRCWEVENWRAKASAPDKLYVTYPEDNQGHDLITCLSCGKLYAVTVVKEVYIGPPLAQKLHKINCIQCGNTLEDNYAQYPDTYIINGEKHSYKKSLEIPDDSLSIVKKFDGIYD